MIFDGMLSLFPMIEIPKFSPRMVRPLVRIFLADGTMGSTLFQGRLDSVFYSIRQPGRVYSSCQTLGGSCRGGG